jgi:mono/diheme cytochrome c family protein
MRSKYVLGLLALVLTCGAFAAQESKKPPQEATQAPSAAATQTLTTPHTYKISEAQKARKNPVSFTDLSVARGEKTYRSQCAMCHGQAGDGKGDLAREMGVQPPDFTKPETLGSRTDGELAAIIGEGSETMPGQGNRMKENEKWQLVNFLRALSGKVPPKATEKQKEEDQNQNMLVIPQ